MPSLFDAKVLSRQVAVLVLGAMPFSVHSWIYPEHRQLSLLAVQQLDGERRAVFDRLWQLARTGDEQRLCASGADLEQGTAPVVHRLGRLERHRGRSFMFEPRNVRDGSQRALDPAGGGRRRPAEGGPGAHPGACPCPNSPAEAGGHRRRGPAPHRQRGRARAAHQRAAHRRHPPATRRPGVRDARRIEPCPLPARAPGNRDQTWPTTPRLTLREGSEINAIGVYSYFHLSALQKASRLAAEPQLAAAERAALARAMLADEAFALHFLQDVFAAGHIAGTWGDRSQRQGTHDYYNHNGLEVFTWAGGSRSVVLMGDAYMRAEDAEVAARTRAHQPRAGAGRRGRPARRARVCAHAGRARGARCLRRLPQRQAAGARTGPAAAAAAASVLRGDPGADAGARPRPGLRRHAALSQRGGALRRPGRLHRRTRRRRRLLGPADETGAYMAGVDLSVRAGFGLDGVLGEAGDGLVYASIGLRSDSPSSNPLQRKLSRLGRRQPQRRHPGPHRGWRCAFACRST